MDRLASDSNATTGALDGASAKFSDVAILGGGILGLATAWKLSQRHPDLSIRIVEKESRLALHQTGRNSGVLHSGIYYAPGSAKARTCRGGQQEMIDFCRDHDVAVQMLGKVIVATSPDELPRLDALAERATANGVTAHRVGPAGLRDLEPHAAGIDALHVPGAGITDYRAVCGIEATIRDGRLIDDFAWAGQGNVLKPAQRTVTSHNGFARTRRRDHRPLRHRRRRAQRVSCRVVS